MRPLASVMPLPAAGRLNRTTADSRLTRSHGATVRDCQAVTPAAGQVPKRLSGPASPGGSGAKAAVLPGVTLKRELPWRARLAAAAEAAACHGTGPFDGRSRITRRSPPGVNAVPLPLLRDAAP
jgi:hypothetical protein